MVKAVAVLSGSEGVKGTIFFTQEGDGNCTKHAFGSLCIPSFYVFVGRNQLAVV
jgi:Cu-Zn family superoxide dismutase